MIRLPKIKTADSVHVYIQEFAKCHQTLFHVLRVGLGTGSLFVLGRRREWRDDL